MNKARRLAPLADYAGNLEAEAAQRLAVSARAVQTKEREVEQLRGYLAEYRQRAELAERFTDSLLWQNTRSFLARLSDAVATHERELQQFTERHRLAVDRWRTSHRHAKSLDQVVERAEQQARERMRRHEQAELDELVLRQTLKRH
jgi:flagellar export protein FliJ